MAMAPAATASADEQIALPKADAYLQPVFLNNGNGLAAAGGPVQVKIALGPPPSVDGDAVLGWKGGRVSSLRVSGVTKDATVTLTCGKRACKGVKRTASKSAFTLLSKTNVKKGTTIVV